MIFSKHAQERLVERFPQTLKISGNPLIRIQQAFAGATPDRSFKNNTAYLAFLVDRYGDCDYQFFVKGQIVFMCKDETVVTVLDRDESRTAKLFGTSAAPSGFRKKKAVTPY